MKILVTGANGYIGERFVRLARRAGHTVVSATRRPPRDKSEWVHFDFKMPALALPAGIDAVVHLATSHSSGPATDVESEAEIQTTRRLIEALPRGAQFLFVSSQTASADAPTSYGRTKWRIEQDVLKNDGVVVRPGQVYGGRPRALFGTLVATIEKLPVLPAFLPAPKVQPIHVDDCALGLVLVLEKKERRRIYSLGAERSLSFNRFLKVMATEFCRRNRFFVPVPKFLVPLTARILGEANANRLGLSRLQSLFRLPALDSAQDLKTLGLKLRSLESGMNRSGSNRRRRLLIEAHAMLTYIFSARPSNVLVRRYVQMIEKLDRGEALSIPSIVLQWPSLFAILETRSRDSFSVEFSWRLNAATLIAEASAMGAASFLGAGKTTNGFVAVLGILGALTTEVICRLMRFFAGLFLVRTFSRGANDDT